MKNFSTTVSLLPKVKTSSLKENTFLTSTSDDILFATHQVDKINRIGWLNSLNKLKPWERISNSNIYSKHGKTNISLIKNIKKKVKKTDFKDFNWSSQNYYNQNQLDKIFDGIQIVKQVKTKDETKKLSKDPYLDLYNFTKQSREICANNMFLDLMKEERKKYNNIIKETNDALERETNNLNNDIKIFEKFKESVKEKGRKIENILNKLINDNKKLFEKQKKYNQEHRSILDEIEKIIRIILNMKHYVLFTNNLLGGDKNFLKENLIEKLEIKNNREKEIEEACELLFKDFDKVIFDDNYNSEIKESLNDDSKLITVFKIMEDNILKNLNQKEEYFKQKQFLMENNELNLKYLNHKIKIAEEEYKIYLKEKNILLNEIENISINNENNNFSLICIDFINNINNEIKKYENKNKNKKKKEEEFDFNVKTNIENIYKYLEKLETNVNNNISNLNKFENEDFKLFSEICENVKKNNRFNKFLIEKQKLFEEAELKKYKLQQKHNNIVILGRSRWKNPIPPKILGKFKIKKEIIVEDNEDKYEMVYYK